MLGESISAFQYAKKMAEQQGGGNGVKFFQIDPDSSKAVRFLWNFDETYVVSHGCGLANADFLKAQVDEAVAAGTPIMCPVCGQPLPPESFSTVRGAVICASEHRFVAGSDGKNHNFLCLQDRPNVQYGLVELNPETGQPYDCPICNGGGDKSKPSLRIMGLCVERNVVMEKTNNFGRVESRIVGVEDVLDEDGKPKVSLIDMSYGAFWKNIEAALSRPNSTGVLTDYDWYIQRMGKGLNTRYDVSLVGDITKPTPLDPTPYEGCMPDVKGYLRAIGSMKWYEEKYLGAAQQPQQPAYAQPQQGYMAQRGYAPAAPAGYPAQPAYNPYAAPAPMPAPAQPSEDDVPWDVMGR